MIKLKMKILIVIFLMSNSFLFSQSSKEYHLNMANTTVTGWLNNLNTGEYNLCYEEMSLKIKEKTDSLDIINMLKMEMETFGSFINRKMILGEFCINPRLIDKDLPNVPDGYYALFIFETIYENWDLSNDHTETLWLHQDDKSRWRILDYNLLYTIKR